MSWIRTASGKRFDPLSPDPFAINIDDIAHALSNICRYTGHCSSFYSVAQHSVLVAKILKDDGYSSEIQLQGLLHDATEAYMNDMARPVKMTEAMRPYRDIEDQLERVIAKLWGFETLTPLPVKQADMICLRTEMRDIMGDPQDWGINCEPRPWKVVPAAPGSARQEFLRWYFNLMKETGKEKS